MDSVCVLYCDHYYYNESTVTVAHLNLAFSPSVISERNMIAAAM
jgi:hypothetical protein